MFILTNLLLLICCYLYYINILKEKKLELQLMSVLVERMI